MQKKKKFFRIFLPGRIPEEMPEKSPLAGILNFHVSVESFPPAGCAAQCLTRNHALFFSPSPSAFHPPAAGKLQKNSLRGRGNCFLFQNQNSKEITFQAFASEFSRGIVPPERNPGLYFHFILLKLANLRHLRHRLSERRRGEKGCAAAAAGGTEVLNRIGERRFHEFFIDGGPVERSVFPCSHSGAVLAQAEIPQKGSERALSLAFARNIGRGREALFPSGKQSSSVAGTACRLLSGLCSGGTGLFGCGKSGKNRDHSGQFRLDGQGIREGSRQERVPCHGEGGETGWNCADFHRSASRCCQSCPDLLGRGRLPDRELDSPARSPRLQEKFRPGFPDCFRQRKNPLFQ